MSNPTNESVLWRAVAWAVIALIAFLAVTHIFATAMVLTMWGPNHPSDLYSGAYLAKLCLLVTRVICSFAIVVMFASRRGNWEIAAVLLAALLLAVETIFSCADNILGFSSDPHGIAPILEDSAIRGFLLSASVLGTMWANYYFSFLERSVALPPK